MSALRHTAPDVHRRGCDCHDCETWREHELRRLTDGEILVLQCFAVFVLTIAAIELVAMLAGFPHVIVMVGGAG